MLPLAKRVASALAVHLRGDPWRGPSKRLHAPEAATMVALHEKIYVVVDNMPVSVINTAGEGNRP
jgi:acyl carrier protein phosphodiesterase